MEQGEMNPLRDGVEALGSIDELESRLEMATCVEIDVCIGEYCWQFSSSYGCGPKCVVHCHPFGGCDPYCYD